jgi:hypothetical protein
LKSGITDEPTADRPAATRPASARRRPAWRARFERSVRRGLVDDGQGLERHRRRIALGELAQRHGPGEIHDGQLPRLDVEAAPVGQPLEAAHGLIHELGVARPPRGGRVAEELEHLAFVGHEGGQAADDGSLLRLGGEAVGHGGQAVDVPPPRAALLDPALREELARGHLGRVAAGQRDDHHRVLVGALGPHGLLLVRRLPALRELEPELHPGMVEDVALEEALARVFAELQAVDVAQVVGPVAAAGAGRRGHGRDLLADPRAAVAGVGVRGEPAGHASLALRGADPLQGGEDVRHGVRVVTHSRHVPQAEVVGLALGVPPVLEEEQAQPRLGQAAQALQLRPNDHPDHQADVRQLRLADLADGVPRGDVADLVAHDAGQLRLGRHVRHQAAGDVHVAAREGEGVDGRIVHQAERPGQRRPLRARGQLLPDPPHVGLEVGVLVDADAAPTSWSACWPICFSCDSETSAICLPPVAGLVAQDGAARDAAARTAAAARLMDVRRRAITTGSSR